MSLPPTRNLKVIYDNLIYEHSLQISGESKEIKSFTLRHIFSQKNEQQTAFFQFLDEVLLLRWIQQPLWMLCCIEFFIYFFVY